MERKQTAVVEAADGPQWTVLPVVNTACREMIVHGGVSFSKANALCMQMGACTEFCRMEDG